MNTAPESPSTTVTPSSIVTQDLHKISAYIRAHEKLIILCFCLAVGIHFYSKVLGFLERYDQRKADLAHETLTVQQQANASTAQENEVLKQQYAELVAQLKQENAALLSAQTARNTATTTQQVVDRQLPPAELGQRWASLINVPPSTIVPTVDGFQISQTSSQETVVQLERVPQLDANLHDETQIASNLSTQITNLTALNSGLNTQIAGLFNENKLQVAACEEDKKLLKAQARKGKLHWYIAGVITGLASRLAFKF